MSKAMDEAENDSMFEHDTSQSQNSSAITTATTMTEATMQSTTDTSSSIPADIPTATPPLVQALQQRPDRVRYGDFVVLYFSDGRHMLCQCSPPSWPKGKAVPLKISKRTYPTHSLMGLLYGTVLEVGQKQLTPLPPGEDLIPHFSAQSNNDDEDINNNKNDTIHGEFPLEQARDNRDIVDNNTSQSLGHKDLQELRDSGVHGSTIVQHIIDNSSTFDQKTDFSKAK
jgi:Gcd10p family